MDEIFPLEGTTASCVNQDFDFLNYWVDQSVEKEILRGKKLQELKQRPSIRKEKYDVISIGHTNIYSKKKRSKRRNKSPAKPNKNGRKIAQCKLLPTKIFIKKESKSSRHRCPMRIAELSVPSKRQCIDTWRTKYHVLPGIMIDRLRQIVLDLSPVVKIPDAIEGFKRHKHMERKRNKEAKEKKMKKAMKKCDSCCKDKIKKPAKVQDCRFLCAIFGHKIAKQLNKPVQITLNTELQKISDVASIEIEKLLCKGKRVNNRDIRNKKVHTEVSNKIAIWISNILEETAYKILEDQLKDFEEEVGPALDLIDDLVDNVVDICEPEPEFLEVSSSSETYNIESSTDDEGQEETQEDDNLSVEIDFPPESKPVELNLDDFIKIELDKIISSFDGDISADEDVHFTEVENQATQNNIEFGEINDKEQNENQTIQNNNELQDIQGDIVDKEQNEFEDANDTFEVLLSEPDTQDEPDGVQAEAYGGPLITDQETDAAPENNLVNDLLSEDDSNKKVKFSDINMVTTEDITEQDAQTTFAHFNSDQFSAPNDNLLSKSDESWPEDISLPILRPSESVSKSITSLGKIMEAEERMSVMLEDDAITRTNMIVNNTKANENINQLDARIWNDTTSHTHDTKSQAEINDIVNTTTDGNDQLKDEIQMKNDNLSDTRQQNNDGIIHETKDLHKNALLTGRDIDTMSHEIEKEEPEPIDTFIDQDRTGKNEQVSYKDGAEPTDQYILGTYIGEDGKIYTKEINGEKDTVNLTDTNKDGGTYTKEQDIEKGLTEGTDTYIGKDGKEQDIEKDTTEKTEKYIDDDGIIYIKEKLIEKYGLKRTEEIIGKNAKAIEGGLIYSTPYDGIHRPSTDSTFDHNIPTETMPYEQKLDKIWEETSKDAASDKILEDEATQVGLKDEASSVTSKKVGIEMADKEINTSFSLVSRADKSTSVVSQSLGDITKRIRGFKADDMFSSLRIKPKVDYRVHKNSAPSWVTRNFGEPRDSYYTTPQHQKKGSNDKNIRLWCKDLENGFDNLELWNSWIENTVESVRIMEIKKARICKDKSRDEFVRDWLHLKKNVDADVLTWTNLSKSTQEKLKGFRKIYQNSETPPDQNKVCNCHT